MKRTKGTEMTMRRTRNKSVRHAMETAAHAYNTKLSPEYFKSLSHVGVVRHLHPSDRPFYVKQLLDSGKITEDEAKEFMRTK